MSILVINLLGDLEIVHDGAVITHEIPAKSQALLAYLAATQREHSRHALAGLFWGDRSEEKAKNSLRVAINGLNNKLTDHLIITRQTVSLNLHHELELDIEQLANLTTTKSRAVLTNLDQAISAYKGDFLHGFTVTDAPEFAEWIDQQQSHWRQIVLRTLTDLAEQYLAEEAYVNALRVLNRHLEIDPCNEEAHRHAMTAYSRQGNINAALTQYQRCQEALSQILGVEPSPETVAIYTSLASTSRRPEFAVPPVQSASQLIGREQELAQLRVLLSNPFSRLITVAGFGGIGKTCLVLSLIADLLNEETNQFLHGFVFVPLVGLESASMLPAATIDALNLKLSRQQDPVDELIENVHNKDMLIVFDGFEHFLDSGIDFLTRLLDECPQVKVLITSREWLNVGMEWRLNLEGLTYPNFSGDLTISAVAGYPAISFFLQEANRIQPGFQLTEGNIQPLCRLCQIVAGIPLALILAATWLRTMSIEAILEEVEHDIDILTSRIRDMPPRQRSMRAVFESTWGQLRPPEKEMFQALSVFRGGFTMEAIAYLLYQEGDWVVGLESLDALSDKALIQYNDTADRYHLHELLRQCGADKLNANIQEKALIQARHCQYYCDLLMKLEPMCKGEQQLVALAIYVAEGDNVYAAWQYATQTHQFEAVANSLDCLGMLIEWRGRFIDGLVLFEATSQMVQTRLVMQTEPLLNITSARIMAWMSNFYRMIGQPEQAKAAIVQSERMITHELLEPGAVQAAQAFQWLQQGHLALDVDNEAALIWYQKSLALYQTLDQVWETAIALEALGLVNQSFGNLNAAEKFIEQSLAVRQRLGDRRGMANALSVLSSITRFQGDIEAAIRYARESNELYQLMDERASMADGLQNLGMTLNSVGAFDEAMELLEVSIDTYRSLNSLRRLSMVHANASHVAGCLGQFDRASYYAHETIRLGEASHEMRSVANGYILLAWHAVVAGHFEQAITLLEKGHTISTQAGGHAEEDIAFSILGYASGGLMQTEKARSIFVSLLRKCVDERDFLPLVTAVPKIALMILQQASELPQGEQELWQQRALTAYTVMKRFPVVGTSKLLETVVTQIITEQIANCPKSLVTRAELAAHSIDLWEAVAELIEQLPTIGWKAVDLTSLSFAKEEDSSSE